jgi:hypothetical protein
MRSQTPDIAVAGARAFGRIGRKPVAAEIPAINNPALTGTQKTEVADAMLRYADAQAGAGNAAEALRLYRSALERTEEHWQCAALIGLAKIGTPEAAAAIHAKLQSPNRTVRITAANAWRSMAGPKV